jgi:hypothetical protein
VRLATVVKGLKDSRKKLWEVIERALVTLIKEYVLSTPLNLEGSSSTVCAHIVFVRCPGSELTSAEDYSVFLASTEVVVAVGEEFGHSASGHLTGLLKHRSKSFLER